MYLHVMNIAKYNNQSKATIYILDASASLYNFIRNK